MKKRPGSAKDLKLILLYIVFAERSTQLSERNAQFQNLLCFSNIQWIILFSEALVDEEIEMLWNLAISHLIWLYVGGWSDLRKIMDWEHDDT